MVDVTLLPENAFGYVPTPALVAPLEFTLRLADYRELGGHMDQVRRLDDVTRAMASVRLESAAGNPWPLAPRR